MKTNQALKEQFRELARNNLARTVRWRRHLHQNPELSFHEEKTSQFIREALTELGIPYRDKVANHGIVGLIEGKNPSKGIFALRADMDALPINEENDVPYRSLNEGVMHACGHDAHTASLLGAANILRETKEHWEGTVKLVFQPAEEKMPGGAKQMIEEGALKNPDASGILGQHVFPQLPAGKLGFKSGMYMASCDEIYLTVRGQGGHGAVPELTIDPVLISSHIVVALQQIISRRASPKQPTVLSFGKIEGNGATNVIPDSVRIEGTFRAFNEDWRTKAHHLIREMASGIAASMGAECEVNIVKGYPFLKNNPDLTDKVKAMAVEYLGEENVVDLDIWMAGEDFAYYSHEIPGCFYRFGVANESKGITSSVHTPTFDIDEDSLEISSGFMAWAAINCIS